jgi:antitoxin component of MazEF toxin-antitoxin module
MIYIPHYVYYQEGLGMQVAKWGNILAARLPAPVVNALERHKGTILRCA